MIRGRWSLQKLWSVDLCPRFCSNDALVCLSSQLALGFAEIGVHSVLCAVDASLRCWCCRAVQRSLAALSRGHWDDCFSVGILVVSQCLTRGISELQPIAVFSEVFNHCNVPGYGQVHSSVRVAMPEFQSASL